MFSWWSNETRKKKSETMVSTLKTPRRYKNEQPVLKKVVVATQKN
jgi:hypothetical protein